MLANADRMPPEANASLQRDVAAGNRNEFETIIVEPVRIGAEYGLTMPVFREVIRKVGPEIGLTFELPEAEPADKSSDPAEA